MRIRLNPISGIATTALFAAGMLCAAPVGQQSSNPANSRRTTETQQTTTTNGSTTKQHTVATVGKVVKFKAGDSLEVQTAKGRNKTFDLNARNTEVSGAENVRNGEMVKVIQRKDNNGKTTISVEPYTSAHHRSRHQ